MSAQPALRTVTVNREDTIGEYTRERLRQHTRDTYVGVGLSKFPEDLRVYEHLLWASQADVVIELGVQFGGSALWFRDRLHALARYRDSLPPRVVAIDQDIDEAGANLRAVNPDFAIDITLLEGDVLDPELPSRVAELIPSGSRCLVVEDTAHTFETTMAALRGFSGFVPANGFFVVEDGCVDVEELRISEGWPRGVLSAIDTWLAAEGNGFRMRRDLELYGVTCHPNGFLQRAE